MKPPISLVVLVASMLLVVATTPGSIAAQEIERFTTAAPAAESARVRHEPKYAWGRITADQIAKTKAHTAYQVLLELRAVWMRPRAVSGNAFQGGVSVYLNGIRMGGIEALHSILANEIDSIQHLNAGEATVRFGTGNGDGAILVNTRR